VTVSITPEVREALEHSKPVVALESAVITHGLPRPLNLELARELEARVRQEGATPATVAVLDGKLHVGLDDHALERLADIAAQKASLWNLAAIIAQDEAAGTTVAVTLHAAGMAGIRVFATGGIGGVHHQDFDESADLRALAHIPVITVSAGPKSILDVAATLERLESLGIPVISYQSDYLAGFHLRETNFPTPTRCDHPREIAAVYRVHRSLGFRSALLVSNPVSEGLDDTELSSYLSASWAAAQDAGVHGKDLTPFLLRQLADRSGGDSIAVNLRLLRENASLAARIAASLEDADPENTVLEGTKAPRSDHLIGVSHE